jgi:hypothetical protein
MADGMLLAHFCLLTPTVLCIAKTDIERNGGLGGAVQRPKLTLCTSLH